ncbi:MAG: DUF4404 family protein [Gammaproteobacteria bacterium]
MPIDRLRADLARLREEIASAEGGEPESIARLGDLAAAVEADLAAEASLGDRAAWMRELEESVSGFEASHPNLAAVLNSLLNALASIGV